MYTVPIRTGHPLVRPAALTQLPCATVCAFVQPGVAIYSSPLALVLADVNLLSNGLQGR